MKRLVVACAVATSLFVATSASRAASQYGGHVAYAIGGSTAPNDEIGGIRQALDLAACLGSFDVVGSRDGLWSRGSGWLAGGTALLGFASYPSYFLAEAGFGSTTTLAAASAFAGLGVRRGPEAAPVLAARATVDLLAVNFGLRLMVVPTRDRELVVLVTVGIGRY